MRKAAERFGSVQKRQRHGAVDGQRPVHQRTGLEALSPARPHDLLEIALAWRESVRLAWRNAQRFADQVEQVDEVFLVRLM